MLPNWGDFIDRSDAYTHQEQFDNKIKRFAVQRHSKLDSRCLLIAKRRTKLDAKNRVVLTCNQAGRVNSASTVRTACR